VKRAVSGGAAGYLARFTHGSLETIVAIPETFYAQSNVSEERNQVLDGETRAARAYADRVIGEAKGDPTLGRSWTKSWPCSPRIVDAF
jgi:hypothetical protein